MHQIFTVLKTLAEVKNTLKVPTEANKIDNLYQVHSYLSAISLNFIFKLMSVVLLFLTLNLKAQYSYKYINVGGNLDMKRGDTIDLIFYPKPSKYPNSTEEDIQVEWRKSLYEFDSFTFIRCFRIKNNFSFDIYLDRVQTGAGYCVPKGFYEGILHPGEVQYTVIQLDLAGKESLSRPVGFFFRMCPYTDEEEKLLVIKRFVGKRKF